VQLRRKRSDHPDEVRTVEKARIELVELSELAVGVSKVGETWGFPLSDRTSTRRIQQFAGEPDLSKATRKWRR